MTHFQVEFRENLSVGSKFERGGTQTDTQSVTHIARS